jgi:hypothetical protein
MPAKKPARRKPARRRAVAAPPAAPGGDVTLLIGQMIGAVTSLKERVEDDREQWNAERADAAEYRKGIRDTLEHIKGDLASMAGHGTRIAALETTAGDYKSFRNRIAGISLAIAFFWTLFGSMLIEKAKKVFS